MRTGKKVDIQTYHGNPWNDVDILDATQIVSETCVRYYGGWPLRMIVNVVPFWLKWISHSSFSPNPAGGEVWRRDLQNSGFHRG